MGGGDNEVGGGWGKKGRSGQVAADGAKTDAAINNWVTKQWARLDPSRGQPELSRIERAWVGARRYRLMY